MSFHKILCPIDFSECSREAMLTALELARTTGGELTLLHVFTPPIGYTDVMGPVSEQAVLAVQETLEDELAAWKAEADAGGRPVTAVLKMGGAGPEILQYARDRGHDLVVMGTHGRSGLKRFFLGSVADKVVRRSLCPVMTVHAHPADAAHTTPHAAGTP